MPDRLTAGQLILVQFVVVRIHLGQHQKTPPRSGGVFHFTASPKLASRLAVK